MSQLLRQSTLLMLSACRNALQPQMKCLQAVLTLSVQQQVLVQMTSQATTRQSRQQPSRQRQRQKLLQAAHPRRKPALSHCSKACTCSQLPLTQPQQARSVAHSYCQLQTAFSQHHQAKGQLAPRAALVACSLSCPCLQTPALAPLLWQKPSRRRRKLVGSSHPMLVGSPDCPAPHCCRPITVQPSDI